MSIKELKGIHEGETCYIVGCGPSVYNLAKDKFGAGIVIVMYNALEVVEGLDLKNVIYSLQKDDYMYEPKKRAILLLHSEESFKRDHPDYQPQFVFDNIHDLGLDTYGTIKKDHSIHSALRLAEYFGCRKCILYGFDAHMNGNLESITSHSRDWALEYQIKSMEGFKSIPYEFAG